MATQADYNKAVQDVLRADPNASLASIQQAASAWGGDANMIAAAYGGGSSAPSPAPQANYNNVVSGILSAAPNTSLSDMQSAAWAWGGDAGSVASAYQSYWQPTPVTPAPAAPQTDYYKAVNDVMTAAPNSTLADIQRAASSWGGNSANITNAFNQYQTAKQMGTLGIQQGPNSQYLTGYGGWQPEGSKYAGDNPMPLDYMQQLPRLDQSSANAVNLALQKAIESAKANGYDPETLYSVNTLRGYFSGDPQARSSAMQYAASSLGANLTSDYGYGGIRGYEGQATTTPTFKTPYDPNWNVPTLYDMINSSLGWTGREPNYADPANRDANLNRKLTDAEIRAFQDGRLTPELTNLVTQYRGGMPGTPVGAPVSGGGVSGGVSGGGSFAGGGVSAGGASGSGVSGAPSTGINLNQLQGTTPWTVQPNQTVQSQLQQIIASDSPLMQQARTRALQTANGRGLLNSTMSQTAADSAMYDAALPIAAADAGLYGEAARFNADASNTFSRDSNAFTRDAFMADFNLAANEWAKQQDQVRTLSTMDYESRLTLERDAIQNGYASAQAAIQNGYSIDSDTRKFNWQSKENALTRDTEGKVTQSQQATIDANTKADARAQINKARQDLTTRLLGIEEAGNLSTEAKDKMIDDVVDGYQTIVRAHIAESGWTGASADVWNYTATARPPAAAAASTALTGSGFDGGGDGGSGG